MDPWLLAEPDSRFAEFYGVQIHYKIAHPLVDEADEAQDGIASQPSTSLGLPAILLHGFGASLFSWERVLKPLARILGSKVVAFDRPAFGLTSRPRIPLPTSKSNGDSVSEYPNPYSVGFSSAATIAFVDFFKSEKAILIGHSAGCIVAADAYLKAPERVAGIIMVAPALVAPFLLRNNIAKGKVVEEEKRTQHVSGPVLMKIWNNVLSAVSKVVAVFGRMFAFINDLWRQMLAAVLRSSFAVWLLRVIMDKLSLQAVRFAWYNREKVDDYVIAGYTKPLRCRDWEHGLLEYVAALVSDPAAHRERPLSECLGEILCPVLIITGDSDGIVPPWNSERLAKILPRAQCRVMKNCGHLPHEENPEEFLMIVQQFIQWLQQGAMVETKENESLVFVPA